MKDSKRSRHKNEITGKTIIINQLNFKGVAKHRDSFYLAEKCFVFQKNTHGCFQKQPQKNSLMSIRVILFKCLKKLKEVESLNAHSDVEQWHYYVSN